MDFNDFLILKEFSDLSQLPTDDIQFNFDGKKFNYSFPLNGHLYEIYFLSAEIEGYDNETSEYFNILTKNQGAYSVGLTIDGSYKQSHTGNAFAVYSKLFAAAKKFIEEKDPNGLIFYGYEGFMDILYKRFYQKYLSAKYVQIDGRNYIKKSFFASLPPEEQDKINNHMKSAMTNVSSTAEFTQKEKNQLRKYRQLFKVGDKVKIISHYNPRAVGAEAIVRSISNDGYLNVDAYIKFLDGKMSKYQTDVAFSSVEKIN